MNSIKVILTFDLDPPTFSDELRIDSLQNYSDEKAILKINQLRLILENEFKSIIPVTIFLRNATLERGFLIEHSIVEIMKFIKISGFKNIELGLHPHINNCVLKDSQHARQIVENLNKNFKLFDENGFKNRIIRFGGNYHCEARSQIINHSSVEIDSSEIFGRNTDRGTHLSACPGSKKLKINKKSAYSIPISTTFIETYPTKKRVYFDFSFKNNLCRDYGSLNILQNTPYFVSISHPATLFNNIYGESNKYEFGVNHWISSFSETYRELSVKFKEIKFASISDVLIKL